jgi:hypothetical protein
MSIVPSRGAMRLLVSSATAMVILGIFGFKSLGLKADWLAFYAAGHFLLAGRLDQVYDPMRLQAWQATWIGANITRYLYPPIYSAWFIPLAIFPVPWARFVWLGAGFCFALAAARLSTRWNGLNFPVSVLALVAFPPFAYSLVVGQISPLSLLIFAGVAGLEWRQNRGFLPGLVAGLALYKPQLLVPLVVYWIFQKRWKSLLGLLGTGVVILLGSWAIDLAAFSAYSGVITQFFNLAEKSTVSGANASLFGLSPWLGAIVGFGVLVAVALTARKISNSYSAALLWLAPILVTPYVVVYDFLLLALPLSFLVPKLAGNRILQSLFILVWITPLLAIPLLNTRMITAAVLILFLFCFYQLFFLKPKISEETGDQTLGS